MSSFDLLKGSMPEDIRKIFEEEIKTSREIAKEKYNNPSNSSSYITVEEMYKHKQK